MVFCMIFVMVVVYMFALIGGDILFYLLLQKNIKLKRDYEQTKQQSGGA